MGRRRPRGAASLLSSAGVPAAGRGAGDGRGGGGGAWRAAASCQAAGRAGGRAAAGGGRAAGKRGRPGAPPASACVCMSVRANVDPRVRPGEGRGEAVPPLRELYPALP